MSPKHLQRYVDEMSFRYNTVNSTDCYRFEYAVGKAENARIRYKELIGDGRKRIKKSCKVPAGDSERGQEISKEIEQERFRLEAEFRGNISG